VVHSLEPLYPSSTLVAAAIAIAIALDVAYPEHRGIALRIHPVHTAFVLARRLFKPYASRIRGVGIWFACVGSHMVLYAGALYLASLDPTRIAWILAAAYVVKVSASIRLLIDIERRALHALERGDLEEAKRWVQLVVRRDVRVLDEPHVVSAAIETLAESLVDGFTSPLLYAALLGPLGALFQRLVNTMDGALGFRDPEFRDVGWFSARADTVVNFVPARLTAALIALIGGLYSHRARQALRTWLRWCRATESVNAGHPMAAMAGVLGVRLEKPGHYSLGEGPLPRPEHLRRAIVVAEVVACIWLGATIVGLIATSL